MKKIAIAAAVLMGAPLITQAKAQVDMQGRHFDDRDPAAFYGERRRGVVGDGPGRVTGAPLRLKRRATREVTISRPVARPAASR